MVPSGSEGSKTYLADVDTRLGRMIEEERIKTEKFKLEVKEKREGWIRLEEWYNRWEEELSVKDKELGEREEGIKIMEKELKNKEVQMREDSAREYEVV